MSERQVVYNRILALIQGRGFDAPYGILEGFEEFGKFGKARTITFGRARTLDAYLVVKTTTNFELTLNGNVETFTTEADLMSRLSSL